MKVKGQSQTAFLEAWFWDYDHFNTKGFDCDSTESGSTVAAVGVLGCFAPFRLLRDRHMFFSPILGTFPILSRDPSFYKTSGNPWKTAGFGKNDG